MKKSLLYLILFLGFFGEVGAQEVPDSALVIQEVLAIQERNLDSLYCAWAEDRLLVPVGYTGEPIDSLIQPTTAISDSMYKERLRSIPTVVDLTFNTQVKSFIEMYTQKRRAQVELMLGLADYYFPIFEEVLMEEGLPMELKYVPVIESGLNPVATSRAGAQGLWQFMYGTAKAYGLQMNSFVDERWDPVKSSKAAVRYLKDLFAIYGDWHLVIAAYNCGPGNVNKAIIRAGGKRNYWDVYYFLPRETRGYVPAFIAAIYVMNYHHAHRLIPTPLESVYSVDSVWVKEDIHLKQISEVLEFSLTDLQRLNPQYRRNIIPTAGGPYAIRLPNDYALEFVRLEDSIANFKRSTYFSQANLNKSPSYAKYTPDAPGANYKALSYKVKSGDNLGFIADWYDVGLSRLRYWNNIYGNTIRVGQKLTVYVPKAIADRYENIDKMSFSEKQANNGRSVVVAQKEEVDGSELSGEYETYTVRSGDNLWSIARQYSGVSNTDIMRLNNLAGTQLKPGQVLKIRLKGE